MKKVDLKKFLLLNFPYFIIFYLVDKTVWLFRHCVGDTLIDRVTVLFNNYGMAFSKPLPSLHIYDLLAGVAAALAVKDEQDVRTLNIELLRKTLEENGVLLNL